MALPTGGIVDWNLAGGSMPPICGTRGFFLVFTRDALRRELSDVHRLLLRVDTARQDSGT